MANALHVISTGLLDTPMSRYRYISRGPRQVFAVPVWDVGAFIIDDLPRKAEVNDVYCVLCLLRRSDQEVLRLHITVDYATLVEDLKLLQELSCDEQHCFQVEGAPAMAEDLLETFVKEVHYHNVHVVFQNLFAA